MASHCAELTANHKRDDGQFLVSKQFRQMPIVSMQAGALLTFTLTAIQHDTRSLLTWLM